MADDNKEVNYLDLSDEELMNMPPPSLEGGEVREEKEEETSEQEVVNETADSENEAEEDKEESGEEDETDEDAQADADEASKPEASEESKSDETKKEEDKEAPEKEVEKIDYEAQYKRLMSPFKANGREITPRSVEDAVALMQMGANYNKKMAALKPNLRLMKMLENNQLLDEEKLSFLIDLDKRKPEAISKLVMDSNLNPIDLDAEKADGYRKTSYAVDEREIELDEVLDSLKESPAYTRTLQIVGSEWDQASKQIVAQQPELLRVLNDHVERGIYDIIAKEVEQERLFGRLTGMSELEAYRQVGDSIQARGGFNHLVRGQGNEGTGQKIVEPKPRKVDEDKLRQKRRAASPTKPSAPKTVDPDFNPLALSDEEFMKTINKQYL
jgi:hypothetical protein